MTLSAGLRHLRPPVLLQSPLLCLIALSACVLQMILLTASSVRGSVELREQMRLREARALAQEVAQAMLREGVDELARERGELEARAQGVDEDFVDVEVSLPGRAMRYRARVLPGEGPAILGLPLSCGPETALAGVHRYVSVAPYVAQPGELPLVAELERESLPESFVSDDSVALLYMPTGTDNGDWNLQAQEGKSIRIGGRAGSVLHVPGNLWITGSETLHFELEGPTTILVDGNLYLDCDVEVHGARLWFAVRRSGARSFRDLDLDGHWQEGEPVLVAGEELLEGGGAVYFGLPGQSRGRLAVAAGLVVEGEVHLLARQTRLEGALVLGTGVTAAGPEHLLVPGIGALPEPERELVPGFLTRGEPRIGFLQAR